MAEIETAGLSGFEAQVLALWDAGSGARAIAKALGAPQRRVVHVLTLYTEKREDRWEEAVRAASTRLLIAIVALQAKAVAA